MNHGNRIYEYYQNEMLKETEENIETKIKKLCVPSKTNFDKITESVESLAEFILNLTNNCSYKACQECVLENCDCYVFEGIQEWLLKEAEDEKGD